MKYKNQSCPCFTLKNMNTSPPAKTRLRQQTICKETYDEKFNKKQPRYFNFSQQILLHIKAHQKSQRIIPVTKLL
jgi:hypothetical protein